MALVADHNVAVRDQIRNCLLAQSLVLELSDVTALPSTTDSIAAITLAGITLHDTITELTGDSARWTDFKPFIGNRGYYRSSEDAQIEPEQGTPDSRV